MAKSKTGGTRAYIRGRIGSDVYSVGKTSDGKKQQVVRSLAETVSNPRTESQMFGRMIMSTVMQAVSALKPIIDHAFDGLPTGQPNISEFIRRNYALAKADALAHPAASNKFGLVKYGEKGAKGGAYVVSAGQVAAPDTLIQDKDVTQVSLVGTDMKVSDFRAASGIGAEGYLTHVCILENGEGGFCRIKIKDTVTDETVISAENVASLFSFEGNIELVPTFESNKVWFSYQGEDSAVSGCAIISRKANGAWNHSAATMEVNSGASYASDVALPTYPVGTELFLNGGSL
jgi:hypothetical protein